MCHVAGAFIQSETQRTWVKHKNKCNVWCRKQRFRFISALWRMTKSVLQFGLCDHNQTNLPRLIRDHHVHHSDRSSRSYTHILCSYLSSRRWRKCCGCWENENCIVFLKVKWHLSCFQCVCSSLGFLALCVFVCVLSGTAVSSSLLQYPSIWCLSCAAFWPDKAFSNTHGYVFSVWSVFIV